MSVPKSLSDDAEEYTCKICGHTFSTAQSLAAHIDLEHPEAEQPEVFWNKVTGWLAKSTVSMANVGC